MHGAGVYIDTNGNVYDGNFQHGKFHGFGKLKETAGDFYEGEYRFGKKNGHGSMTDAEGNKYIGEWKDNMRWGFGTYEDVLDGVYKGQYHNDVRHGPGYYFWLEGEVDAVVCKNGVRVGKGVGWNHDRKECWLMMNGQYMKHITINDGKRITQSLGLEVTAVSDEVLPF